MWLLAKILILFSLVSASAAAATLHTDTFDAAGSTLGWDGGSPLPVHLATGGPAGVGDGFIKVVMAGNLHLATFNMTAVWQGDFAAIGATRVTADLMVPSESAPLEIRLVLFTINGGRWTSNVAQIVPADDVWRNYNFSFAEANMTQVQGIETYTEMLTTIDRVMFRHQTGAPFAQTNPVFHPGDFQNNFVVNNADLTAPGTGFNARFGVNLEGDDFLAWQLGYGGPVGALNVDNAQLAAGAPGAAVPEPSGTGLAAAAIALAARRRAAVLLN